MIPPLSPKEFSPDKPASEWRVITPDQRTGALRHYLRRMHFFVPQLFRCHVRMIVQPNVVGWVYRPQ